MGKFSALLMSGVFLAASGGGLSAQTFENGLSEAQFRLACGTGRVVGAETLPGGSIRVTCEQSVAGSTVPQELLGNGLTPAATAGVVGGVLFIGILFNNGSSESTTQTSRSVTQY